MGTTTIDVFYVFSLLTYPLNMMKNDTPLTKYKKSALLHEKIRLMKLYTKYCSVILTHFRLQFHYQLILYAFLVNFFLTKMCEKALNISFHTFI